MTTRHCSCLLAALGIVIGVSAAEAQISFEEDDNVTLKLPTSVLELEGRRILNGSPIYAAEIRPGEAGVVVNGSENWMLTAFPSLIALRIDNIDEDDDFTEVELRNDAINVKLRFSSQFADLNNALGQTVAVGTPTDTASVEYRQQVYSLGSSHKCMHDLAPGRSASAVGRRCGCARARYAAVQSSVAQLTAACAGPALGGGPARRQPDQTQAADTMALTWRRTVKDSGTRPRLSPMFCAGAERSRRWGRGAFHPYVKGESLVGAELRDHRRPPPGLACVQADVQRTVDAGEVRLSESSPSATRLRRAGRGRVEVITFKPLSKNPGALHSSHKCMHDLAPGRSASAVGRRCGCARARYAAVQSSVAQLTAACAGPALGGGPARRQPDQTQAADTMALTWRRTVKDSGTRPRLSPMFCAGAERSLTVQPPWNGQSVTIPVSGVAGLSGSPQLLSRYRRCSLVT